MSVFVLDKRKHPLMPCSEKRARKLLAAGRARVHRLLPFSIRIIDREVKSSTLQPLKLKLDPGSKFTGMPLVCEVLTTNQETGEISTVVNVLSLVELVHRGRQISEALTARRHMRRRRRSCLRYRAPRFLNRGNKKEGWLAPSLQHRIDTVSAWVTRFRKLSPIAAIAQELVRFDMQLLQNPEISGVEYQQGTLVGFEVREYLLNKWNRECAYCGTKDVPLQVEHIHPKAKGGSNRISNLALACGKCNQRKGSQDIVEFLKKDPAKLKKIQAQATRPLKDAAAVNATRWKLFNTLKSTGLNITTGSGGLTKFNRTRLEIPKSHALDAVCVGNVSEVVNWQKPTITIKATGRGSYQRTRLDAYGFPRGYLTREKRIKGFQTGDRVTANVSKGKKAGSYTGRVAVRASGSFNINIDKEVIQGVSYKHCKVIQRADGYGYSMGIEQKGCVSR